MKWIIVLILGVLVLTGCDSKPQATTPPQAAAPEVPLVYWVDDGNGVWHTTYWHNIEGLASVLSKFKEEHRDLKIMSITYGTLEQNNLTTRDVTGKAIILTEAK